MPYYIYRVFPDKRLEKIEEFPAFREASVRAKTLRREIPADQDYLIKMVFAETPFEAQLLLAQPRQPEPLTGDDW